MNGARAVVLGATGGFGAEIARSLATAGATLAVHGRDPARLQAISAEVGGHPIAGDLTEPGVPDAVVDEAAQALGGLDVVVMSAGAVAFGPVAALDEDVLRRVVDLDLIAPILVARAATRHLQKDGVIAQVSAVVADQPMAGLAAYSAAKAGLTAFDTAFRREMRRQGVRVLDARPPHMETGLATRPIAGEAPGLAQGRDPREVADELVAVIGGSAEAPDWID
ncbi:MAG: SDR family oxidoreductase [Actinobacteria bacterium]|nr:SDR family oxidoreductase [Actinomycetota bacterium]MBM3697690.1 SDR family oxidoreductase [Actinomycetota bacterium]